ncbi:MAG: archaellin/type IV pilin N-terminal domain-containing protein [Candidatus Bathyarchaeia archaeon]
MRTKSRKALSPVIASIILIAVTVAVSIAVAAWMGALTFGFMGSSSLTITDVNFDSTAPTRNMTLTIKNTGTKQVTIAQVKINNVNIPVANWTIAGPINPSTTSPLIVSYYAWTNGNPYKIDLYDSSGTGVGSTQQNAPGA